MSDAPKSSRLFESEPDLAAHDPYRVLGLPPAVSQADIKQAYFALIRHYPPETEPEKFKIIRGAYEKLKDAHRRIETDIFRPQPPPPWQPPPTKPALDTAFHPSDALTVLRCWGELGRTDFQEDFSEIEW